jgi:1-phosphatidylinositol-4-phosphate 5-kinase
MSEHAKSSNLSERILEQITKLKQKIVSPRSSFLFTDYSPKRFARIRELSNIDVHSYLESFKSTTMPSFSEGKSGAFLYFSSDYEYIVKTTTPREFEKLLQMLPSYVSYLEQESKLGRTSLLTRYLGAHRIIMYDIPLYFVVMKNICPVADEKYDLKGSWINRHGSKMNKDPQAARPKKNYMISPTGLGERRSAEDQESTPLFLDNDLQNCFLVHPAVACKLAAQIDRDSKFLEGN